MALNYIIQNSIVLQNWSYLLTTVFLVLFILKIVKIKKIKKAVSENENVMDAQCKETSERFQPALKEMEHVSHLGATLTLSGGAQQFYEMVNNRRSVRDFSQRTVEFATIETCILAAATGPSGAHTEPWTFCVIGAADMKKKLRDIIEAEEYLNYKQRMHRQWTADLKPLRTNHIKKYLTDAPYLILVFKQIYGYIQGNCGQRKQHYYNEISVAIATGILLSALQAAGLSSLVTTPLNCGPAIRSLLDRPVNEKLLLLIPVGYAAVDCKIPNLQRKKIEEILVNY